MTRMIILLLIGFFLFPNTESRAQSQYNIEAQASQLSKKQIRKMQRDQRKKEKEAAQEEAFNEAIQAIEDKNWVLEANVFYGRNGKAVDVNSTTNFIQFKDTIVFVQFAMEGRSGQNGLGGMTFEGMPSHFTTHMDKNGNHIYHFRVNGLSLSAEITLYLNKGNNYAQATVYPIMSNRNMSFSGQLYPTKKSEVYRSGFIRFKLHEGIRM